MAAMAFHLLAPSNCLVSRNAFSNNFCWSGDHSALVSSPLAFEAPFRFFFFGLLGILPPPANLALRTFWATSASRNFAAFDNASSHKRSSFLPLKNEFFEGRTFKVSQIFMRLFPLLISNLTNTFSSSSINTLLNPLFLAEN